MSHMYCTPPPPIWRYALFAARIGRLMVPLIYLSMEVYDDRHRGCRYSDGLLMPIYELIDLTVMTC